jgi:high-affinity nickel-transport protein
MIELLAVSGLGTLVGMRHALEPDHLAAVTTLVSRERSGRRAATLGVCWGLGHTFALVVAASALLLVQREMPAGATVAFELMVAVMLIVLGARAMMQTIRAGRPAVSHAPEREFDSFLRPLLVGMVHGLAGSGALTALVLSTLPTVPSRLAFVALFGAASTLSMAAASGLLGWPLARLGARHIVTRGVTLAVGVCSAMLGVVWGSAALRAF